MTTTLGPRHNTGSSTEGLQVFYIVVFYTNIALGVLFAVSLIPTIVLSWLVRRGKRRA